MACRSAAACSARAGPAVGGAPQRGGGVGGAAPEAGPLPPSRNSCRRGDLWQGDGCGEPWPP